MAASKGTWIGGTVFAALALGAGAWFLAVQPQSAAAADLRSQTDEVESQNAILGAQIEALQLQSTKLSDYESQLDALRVQIPTTAQASEFLRQLNAIAAAHAVTITGVLPGTAEVFAPAVVAAPSPAPTPTEGSTADSGTDTEGGTADTDSTPAPSMVPDGFAAIPVAISVLGSYDNTLAFLSDLQVTNPRLFLVTGLTALAQREADAGGGRPATAVGDQELQVTGYLYVLPDTAATPAPDPTEPTAPAPGLPAPVPGKNPLVPITGQ